MDEDAVVAALPETYAKALRLRSLGVPPSEMADLLGVPVDALEALICLAEAKLARLRAPWPPKPREA